MTPSSPTLSTLTIGTRGSPLALAQAHQTRVRLSQALGMPEADITLDIIRTTGDRITDRPLSEAGGKGLFTKEIDEAQLRGEVDIAVHSGKDLPTALPPGLVIAGFLPREDVRDVFIGRGGRRIDELNPGSVVGTASLRRQAQVRRLRPDLAVTILRGNVGTRLSRLEAGEVDGTLLALAGLRRLDLAHHASEILDVDQFLPAVAQGAIALVVREGDEAATRAARAIICEATTIAVTCERAFLTVLDGSCRTPIAGHAVIRDGRIHFRGEVLTPDGTQAAEVALDGSEVDAERIGRAAGEDILSRVPAGILPAHGRT